MMRLDSDTGSCRFNARTLLRFSRPASMVLLLVATVGSGAQPRVPGDPNEILERVRAVRSRTGGSSDVDFRDVRRQLAAQPGDLRLAKRLAGEFIEQGRSEADPRFFGYAQAALAPWWNEAKPPVDVLVLRATIRQYEHDFPRALADLNAAVRLDPAHAGAWLTRTTLLIVQGNFREARKSAVNLVRHGPELLAATAASHLGSLTGQAQRSYEHLSRTLARNEEAPASDRLWAQTVLAEISGRLGRLAEAREHFKMALGLDPEQRDLYLLGAYADFLMNQGEPEAVIELLKECPQSDPLLLRVALAERNISGPRSASSVARLRERFEMERLRGDTRHLREAAAFNLWLVEDAALALPLARANWEVQKEIADMRLLMEAALAAGEPSAAQPVMEFMEAFHLEDISLNRLASRLSSRESAAGGIPSPGSGRTVEE